jgi:hypothetical protein
VADELGVSSQIEIVLKVRCVQMQAHEKLWRTVGNVLNTTTQQIQLSESHSRPVYHAKWRASEENTAKCSCPLTRLRAKKHQRLHRHSVMVMINEAFCKPPWLSALHFLYCGVCVETWSRQPTDRHSVLLGLMSIRPFYHVAWPLS